MALPTRANYRPDIDGLRAIAILSVVGYHVFPEKVPGGFIGVDVFFVISGFLISSIIFGGLAKGQFSFREFYARRIKRIFPALILVLAACFAVGGYMLTPVEFKNLGKHIAGGAGFVSNIVLWNEAGYFDTSGDLKPLLHLWSLGIEEQFYFTWPLLLYLAWKKRPLVPWVLAGLLATSFLFNAYETRSNEVAAFYSPLARFWELTMGSALAYLTVFRAKGFPRIHPNLKTPQAGAGLGRYVAPAGLLAIAAATILLSKEAAFPGYWALLPTCGAVLLISAGPNTWASRYVLSNRIMVFIGLISYPLYLWHWPLLAFARIAGSGSVDLPMRIAAVSVSFVLATLTYLGIEKPIRLGGNTFAKVFVLAALMAGITFAGFNEFKRGGADSIVAHFTDPQNRMLIGEYASLNYDFKTDGRGGRCWLPVTDGPEKYAAECVEGEKSRPGPAPLVFVWGDSHAARLFPGIRSVLGGNYRLAEFTRDNCPPVLDFSYDLCIKSNAFVMDKIRENRPKIAILFAAWNRYGSWMPGSGGSEKLRRTISELQSAGVDRVLVIGPPPQWRIDLPRNLLNIYHHATVDRVPLRTKSALDDVVQPVDFSLARLFDSQPYVTYVSAFGQFCNEQGCLTRVNEEASGLTSWDYGHLTTAAAEYLARRLPIRAADRP
jgi:peptidoglycan/LPS O-acetylase OafA/YrhL